MGLVEWAGLKYHYCIIIIIASFAESWYLLVQYIARDTHNIKVLYVILILMMCFKNSHNVSPLWLFFQWIRYQLFSKCKDSWHYLLSIGNNLEKKTIDQCFINGILFLVPSRRGPCTAAMGTRLEAPPNLVWWQLEAILASVPQFKGVASCTILIVLIGVVGIKPVVDIYKYLILEQELWRFLGLRATIPMYYKI